MSIADDYAAYLSQWDVTGDLQTYAKGIGSMFAEVESYAADIDSGALVWTPNGYAEQVVTRKPVGYWRLGEAAGAATAADQMSQHSGTYVGSQAPNLVSQPLDSATITSWLTVATGPVANSGATIAADATQGEQFGTTAAKVVVGAAGEGVHFALPGTFAQGVAYTLSVYLRLATGTGTVRIAMEDNLLANGLVSQACSVTSSWTRFSVTWTPTATSPNPMLYIYTTTSDAAITFWANAVQVTQTAAAVPYSDTQSVTLGEAGPLSEPGTGALLDGQGGYITVPYSAALATSTFSATAWIKPTATQTGIIFNGTNGSSNHGFLFYYAAGALNCYVGNGTTNLSLGGGISVPLNAWSHVAITYDGATVTLYVNGVQANQSAWTGYVASPSGTMSIGNWDAVGNDQLSGYIEEVAVYNRALAASEVAADYAAQTLPGGAAASYAGSQVGWQPLWDVDLAPSKALSWLCMIAGEIAPQGATNAQLQALIKAAPNQSRGTPQAIANAVKQLLTGGQLVGIKERWRSDTPAEDDDAVSIFTYASQTPNQNAVLAALRRTVPADIAIYYSVQTAPTWSAIETAAGSGSWSNLYTHFSAGSWSTIESGTLALPGYTIY